MKILILDDDEFRHDYFARELQNHDLVHVYNYDECVSELSKTKFDTVFLDHDINDPNDKDGRDVTRFMIEEMKPEFKPRQVIVHSMNFTLGNEMYFSLRDAGFNVRRWIFDPTVHLR